jgi:hemerythrin-like domain-containing protein
MIGETSAIPTLEKLAVDQEWWVRLNASRSLVNMGSAGEQALARILEGPDRFARDRVAAVLQERGIVRRLVEELAEGNGRSEDARNVIQALVRNGATRYLNHLARTLPEKSERQTLRKVMAEAEAEPNDA